MTRAQFRPQISYNFGDVLGICVGEIKWGCAGVGKIRVKRNFVSSIDWSGLLGPISVKYLNLSAII